MYNLDTLTQETNLRKVWPNEAKDFTPWLAEHLEYIGNILEMDLELVEKESKVGGYSADILAKAENSESDTESYVVIENQLEDSNHDHLGKLITYASGKKAKAIVWVVKTAREEHREAIKWLNDNTNSELSFYLLEIELWHIGNSKLAPKFNVVERPNEWAKVVKTSNDVSDTTVLQLEFWQAFIDYASKTSFAKSFRMPSAHPQNWFNLAIGSSKYNICLEAKKQKQEATVGIYIYEDKSLYHKIESDKHAVEIALNSNLHWTEAKKASRFYESKSFDMADSSTWEEVFKWYIEKCIVLKKIIQKYL
ncbi:MAG: DUF4268 domain-containing protein [Muribaculaceae bacterium]|nr:DUF4268 domain-containing protein [Muribaculaceae bacterium]